MLILKVQKMNLTANWDGTVESFKWSVMGKKSILAVDGTKQLFEVNFPGLTCIAINVNQITNAILMSMKL
jgi:hypothetical protein